MPAKSFPVLLCCLATLGAVASVVAQRGVRTLTSIGASEAKLSPNGSLVAFKTSKNGVSSLAVVSTLPASTPTILVTNSALTQFLWTPDSSGLYYQLADTLVFIRSVGGTPQQVTKLSGVNHRMFAVDSKDNILVGTRSDGQGTNAIFTVATSGAVFAKDILTSNALYFDEIQVDPTDTSICYTAQLTGFPHAPIEIRKIDLDGQNDGTLSGGALPGSHADVSLPRNLSWVDATTVVFAAIATQRSTWELMRVRTTANTPEALTLPPQHFQRPVVARGGLIAFVQTTFHGNSVPGIMSIQGGARVPLEPEESWVFAGDPSVDSGGLQVAFAGYPTGSPGARPEVQLIELAREIEVAPQPSLGQAVKFDFPLLFNERGTLFLSGGLGSNDPKQQFKIPGLDYAVAVDAAVLLPLLSGVGTGVPLTFTAAVPNDSSLVGVTVYLQGMRLRQSSPDQGDFTRYAELQFLL